MPSGADEAAHYIKALATGRGELTGTHVPYPFRGMSIFPGTLYYWDQSTIAFRVPAKQAPASTGQCDDGNITGPTTCVSGTRCQRWVAPCTGSPPVTGDVVLGTYVGNYVPLESPWRRWPPDRLVAPVFLRAATFDAPLTKQHPELPEARDFRERYLALEAANQTPYAKAMPPVAPAPTARVVGTQ